MMILEGVRAYFEELKEIGPDALIISDPGVFTIAKEVCPEIDMSYQHAGKQYQLRHLSVLAEAGRKQCCDGA